MILEGYYAANQANLPQVYEATARWRWQESALSRSVPTISSSSPTDSTRQRDEG